MEAGIKKNLYPILADTSRSLEWQFQNSLAAMTVTPYPILADTSRSLKWQFQNSLAAMTVTTSYLTQLEQIEFQALNKWWYGRAAERIQRKVFLENTFYFELGLSIFSYNKMRFA